jgi:hypothetical protein
MRKELLGTIVLAGLILAACDAVAAPTLSPGVGGVTEVVEPMQIFEVTLTGLDAEPPQPAVFIEGIIGDSCNQLDSVTQSRDQNVVSIQINIRRTTSPAEACEELAQVYSETIPLEGEFPPGDYTLLVNGRAAAFSVGLAATPAAASTPDCKYNAEVVGDVSFPAGSAITGGEPFLKSWRLRNTGTCPWDSTVELVRVEGDNVLLDPPEADAIPMSEVLPGAEVEVGVQLTVSLQAPIDSEQSARFQMRTPDGVFFGEQPVVVVTVADTACTFNSEFLEDVTIPDGDPVAAGQPFVKTWRVRNNGNCPWDQTFQLAQIEGETITPTGGLTDIPLPDTAPGAEVDVSVELVLSPQTEIGSREVARFQITDPDGEVFGNKLFVLVTVAGTGAGGGGAVPEGESEPTEGESAGP